MEVIYFLQYLLYIVVNILYLEYIIFLPNLSFFSFIISLSNSYLFLLPPTISTSTLMMPGLGWAGIRAKSTNFLQQFRQTGVNQGGPSRLAFQEKKASSESHSFLHQKPSSFHPIMLRLLVPLPTLLLMLLLPLMTKTMTSTSEMDANMEGSNPYFFEC